MSLDYFPAQNFHERPATQFCVSPLPAIMNLHERNWRLSPFFQRPAQFAFYQQRRRSDRPFQSKSKIPSWTPIRCRQFGRIGKDKRASPRSYCEWPDPSLDHYRNSLNEPLPHFPHNPPLRSPTRQRERRREIVMPPAPKRPVAHAPGCAGLRPNLQ
jgi:hypothetical protein